MKKATPAIIPVEKLQAELDRRVTEQLQREAETYRASFRSFVAGAWHIVEPGTEFLPGYHIDAIAEHLQAVQQGQIKRLLINVPPRHSKSLLSSTLFNAWWWTLQPSARFLSGSYALSLATSDAVRTRRVVTSDWYKERFPEVVIQDDQAQKQFFQNTMMGQRQVCSTGGTTTGLGADAALILDDPISAQQADSAVLRAACLQWYRESFSTRASSAKTARVVIMQRLHANDLSGWILKEEADLWEHLCLPMEYPGGKKTTSIGWTDPRENVGDILWPLRYDHIEVAALKRTLGSVGFAGQMQQAPVPRGGATFRREWLRFWYDENLGRPDPVVLQKTTGEFFEAPQRALPQMDQDSYLASFDLSFKGGIDNDYVVGQVWARPRQEKTTYFLLDQERGQYDFVATLPAITRLLERNACPITIVEDRANGAAVISALKAEVPGLIAINPQGGKESRANACAPLFEAGQIYLPHPSQAAWVEQYIDELLQFPRGAHDDCVDATTQALARMRERPATVFDAEGFATVSSLLRANPWSGI